MVNRIGKDIIDLLLLPSTATLTSVMRELGVTNVFMHRVEPLCSGMKMAGPAFTLRYIPARQDLDTGVIDNLRDVQRIGIEEIAPGQVLVIDARGIACGGVDVVPNDIIVGDGEGVVVVPASMAEKVAEMAITMEEKEDFLLEKIRAGESIVGVYPPDETIIGEYEEWKIKKARACEH